MTNLSQGAQANKNGQIGEDTLIPLFNAHNYTVLTNQEYNKKVKNKSIEELNKYVVKQYPYETIYKHKGKTEFLIRNKEKNREIRVEVKWQQAAGSVDEKYPYLWLNVVYSFPEKEIIIICDGGGYKKGAREWLEKQVEERWLLDDPDKKVSIMTLAEFITFFNKELS